MTIETRLFVRMPVGAIDAVRELERRSVAALQRAAKAPVGDRTDVLRYERSQSEIELLAIVAANGGAPTVADDTPSNARHRSCVVAPDDVLDDVSPAKARELQGWLAEGAVVVECATPLALGETARPQGAGRILPTAQVWESPTKSRGKAAVRERFLSQLEASLSNPIRPAPISPSGVSNSVLTDGLRDFVARSGGAARVDVPVVYRDGSAAQPFPLRALDLIDSQTPLGTVLAFSLLSIRHVALDALVDGAWLRNTDVSRPRPAADTDELVYRESTAQLARLCNAGPTTIVLYQTGLDTAIVGFYRAVAHRLLLQPNRLAVLPRYYQQDGDYVEGKSWRVR